MSTWIVPLPDRLDSFLSKDGRFPSRAKAQQAIESGLVLVNDGIVTKPAQRLQEGDSVTLTGEPARAPAGIQSLDLSLSVLYEDNACIVINKPAGVAVHPGAGIPFEEPTILHGIAHLFTERGIPFFTDSVLAHRLDRDTTGCLLIAKSPDAHRALQKQFEDRTIAKFYLALVAGVPTPSNAVIDAPIGRATFERTKMSVTAVSRTREARTTYRTLGASGNASLLLCELHTGRTHQLRVHLSAIGHPILGDTTYTSSLSERVTQELDIRTLCLHAWRLVFDSPTDGKTHEVVAPLQAAFDEVLKRIGIAAPVSPSRS